MSLTVVFRESALRTLADVRKDDKEAFARIRRAIAGLADQPYPDGAIAWGGTGIYRPCGAVSRPCAGPAVPRVRRVRRSTTGNGGAESITLASVSGTGIERRVVAAAEEALAQRKFVTAIDVCIGIGWLHSRHVDSWRNGRVPELESFLPVHGERLAQIPVYLQRWAQASGLKPVETPYVAATRDLRPLRFTSASDPVTERAWRTHWTSAAMSAPQQERMAAPPDLVVVQPVKDWVCAECGGTGDLLIMDDHGPLCLTCADLDHLVFLPAGDAALTRRSKKASGLSAVVVRWSRARKRYERRGLLVEEPALEQAEQECLADEDARMRAASHSSSTH